MYTEHCGYHESLQHIFVAVNFANFLISKHLLNLEPQFNLVNNLLIKTMLLIG